VSAMAAIGLWILSVAAAFVVVMAICQLWGRFGRRGRIFLVALGFLTLVLWIKAADVVAGFFLGG
jgi:hypothetical protein